MSDSCVSLPNYAVRLLVAIAAQYRGNNNGDLAMTRAIARQFGIYSQEHLVFGLVALMERFLIQKTRQGGKKPFGPTLYAVTWQPIDDLAGKIELLPTTTASNAWSKWKSGPPADQSKKKHRVYRRNSSGLSAEQNAPKSGLPPDQAEPSVGSAGSPPSRIWGEGTHVADIAHAEPRGTINCTHGVIASAAAHVRHQD